MSICTTCKKINEPCTFNRTTDPVSGEVTEICDYYVESLRSKRNRLIEEAATIAHEYAASCDVGPERTKAFTVYERILYSTRESYR